MIEPNYADPTEIRTLDDMASQQEALHLAMAIKQHQVQAAKHQRRPGVCANCNEPCLPQAVYCDEGCRDDHERRLRSLRLQGRA